MVLRPTEEELAKGLPLFLNQLIESLRRYNGAMPQGPLEIGQSALQFGRDLSHLGFTVTQLVHGYGAVSELATALAHEHGHEIGPEEHEVLNAALDIAIAHAVDGYQQEHDQGVVLPDTERPQFHVHELRSALAAASVSFRTLKRSGALRDGRVADLLERSLRRMRRLIDCALAEERLRAQTEPHMADIPLMELVDQTIATALLGVDARRLTMAATIDPDLNVRGDRQLLVSALANLVDDAVAATRPGGHVQLRGSARSDMVVVQIEDECADRSQGQVKGVHAETKATGSGQPKARPGLPIARQAVSLHNGTVSVREIPGKGCVVTVEIPSGARSGSA
jgi:signal transduction histidine kinase